MIWYWTILFQLSLIVFVNGKFTINDAHCEQEGYNLEHTLSIGIVRDWIVQITVNLQLILYPHRSTEQLTLFNGSGDSLAILYPGIKDFRTYRQLEQLSPEQLKLKTTFGTQKDEKIMNIYAYIYQGKELNYFQQQFDSKIGPIEFLNINSRYKILKLVTFWTTNLDSKLLADNTKTYNYHLASVQESGSYVFYWTTDLNYYQSILVCYDGNTIKKTQTTCESNDWINQISFAFFFQNRIYFISVTQKKIWSIDEKFVLFSENEFPLEEIEYESFFKCQLDDNFIPDRNYTNTTLISDPVINKKFNWKTLILIFIVVMILIIILIIIFQFIPDRKRKKDNRKNLKRKNYISSWYSSGSLR